MKHTITWRMTGTIEYDSDETDPIDIARDFNEATQEGFDFMRHGDVDDFYITDVDDEHVHQWILSYLKDNEFCPTCYQRRDVMPS